MNLHDAPLQELLKRTSLTSPFDTFLSSLKSQYESIGEILLYEPITEGYESANILMTTSTGKYVLKLFESDRSRKNIDALIQVLIESSQVNVLVPRLVEGEDGFLSSYEDDSQSVYYYLTEYFEGENFENKTPTLDEMISISVLLARLNTLKFEVVEAYDAWGNKNLIKEYRLNEHMLSQKDKNIIHPIVEKMMNLEMRSFSKAVIHGDMQRKHVLKNAQNEFCILDFGCMSHDYKVIEVSTYLAWFCLSQETWDMKDEIMAKIIDAYMSIHKLSEEEIKSIPILIQAAYASYFLKTSLLIQDGDQTEETMKWHRDAQQMLAMSTSLH